MGGFCTKETECDCKECDRLLTEQFMNGMNDAGMINEILRGSHTRGH